MHLVWYRGYGRRKCKGVSQQIEEVNQATLDWSNTPGLRLCLSFGLCFPLFRGVGHVLTELLSLMLVVHPE